MIENVLNRKIELFPHKPSNDKECVCQTCGGTGYMIENNKFLVQCTDCYNGIVPKCKYCGNAMKRSSYSFKCVNPDCNWEELNKQKRLEEEILKEKERVKKANHYSLTNCPKESCIMMYSEVYDYNDGYFSEIDELQEYCDETGINMPEYVWGTRISPFSLDATDWIESRLEASYEDAWSNVDDTDIAKLQIACDDFVKNQHGCLDTFYIDYSTLIELD